jgi:uncharacterized membrane protein
MASRSANRIETIDAARGTAMLVVFLAHFADAYYAAHPRHQLFILVTRVASPAFIFLSGVMLGLLHQRHLDDFGATRERFIDRGLFLLLIGHPLLMGGMFFRSPRWVDTLEVMFITDTIGVCLIIGAWLVPHLGARARLLLGAGSLFLAWVLVIAWDPRPHSDAWWAKDILTADWRADGLPYKFPLLPWFGLYLMGSSAGSVAAEQLGDASNRRRLRRILLAMAGVSGVLAFGVRLAMRQVAAMLPPGDYATGLRQLASVTEKLPPGPGYVLFYGGMAMVMFWAILLIEDTAAGRAYNRWAALFGRCSLVCFIAQFYVYYTGVFVLPKPPEVLAPLYFALTVALLRLSAVLWQRRGLNRVITVGFPKMVAAWHASRAPAPLELAPRVAAASSRTARKLRPADPIPERDRPE